MLVHIVHHHINWVGLLKKGSCLVLIVRWIRLKCISWWGRIRKQGFIPMRIIILLLAIRKLGINFWPITWSIVLGPIIGILILANKRQLISLEANKVGYNLSSLNSTASNLNDQNPLIYKYQHHNILPFININLIKK